MRRRVLDQVQGRGGLYIRFFEKPLAASLICPSLLLRPTKLGRLLANPPTLQTAPQKSYHTVIFSIAASLSDLDGFSS